MNKPHQKVIKNQRIFNVGIIGASNKEMGAISRIFAITDFRNRCYKPKHLHSEHLKLNNNIDFCIIFTSNQSVINEWSISPPCENPSIYLSKSNQKKYGQYQLSSPVNPGKFIQLLDRYTIKELHYFPEFEIGNEDIPIDTNTISGLKVLKSNLIDKNEDHESRQVLVVDDSLAVQRQMLLEFQLRSDALDIVSTAEEALNAIHKKRYDIIFLDVVMPGMDGYSACKKIKKNRNNSETPVILLTSKSSSFDKIKGALAGCDAYLVKPINHNEFDEIYAQFTNSDNLGETAHAS